MKNRLFQVIGCAAIFALGVATGVFCTHQEPPATADAKPSTSRRKIASANESDVLKSMRRRVAELEAKLAEAAELGDQASVNVSDERNREFRHDPAARLEELRVKDPERYQQMTNRMEQFRLRRQERMNARLEFLSSIDTSHMGKAARATHEQYQELLVRREELESKLHDSDLTESERHSLWKQLRELDQASRQAGKAERRVLVEETARTLGFDRNTAKTISATIRDIDTATEAFHMPPPDGPRGGGGGMPPNGGGPR